MTLRLRQLAQTTKHNFLQQRVPAAHKGQTPLRWRKFRRMTGFIKLTHEVWSYSRKRDTDQVHASNLAARGSLEERVSVNIRDMYEKPFGVRSPRQCRAWGLGVAFVVYDR